MSAAAAASRRRARLNQRITRQRTRSVRAARSAGVIGVGEPHALVGQAVDGGDLVKRAAVAAEIPLAEVVGEDEDDVERLRRLGTAGAWHHGELT
jgi:hypothetical protein